MSMKKFRDTIYKIDTIVCYIGCFLLVANVLIVVYSVFIRLFLGSAFSGLTDIVGFVSAAIAAMAFGYTQKEHSFIQVDFIKEYFPKSIQKVIHIIIGLISMAGLTIITYGFIIYGIKTIESGTVTWVMYLPYYPICFLLAVGCLLYLLTTIYDFAYEISLWKENK